MEKVQDEEVHNLDHMAPDGAVRVVWLTTGPISVAQATTFLRLYDTIAADLLAARPTMPHGLLLASRPATT